MTKGANGVEVLEGSRLGDPRIIPLGTILAGKRPVISMPGTLVGYDGSQMSRRALEYALSHAAEEPVHVLSVVPASLQNSSFQNMLLPGMELPALNSGNFVESAERRLDELVKEYAKNQVKIETHVRTGDAAEQIIETANKLKCAHIVIGHKSYETHIMDLGSVAAKVMRYAKTTVTVVR